MKCIFLLSMSQLKIIYILPLHLPNKQKFIGSMKVDMIIQDPMIIQVMISYMKLNLIEYRFLLCIREVIRKLTVLYQKY